MTVTDIIPLFKVIFRLESGLTFRDVLWKAALRMFAESPILGNGPGFYDSFKYIYMEPSAGRTVIGTWTKISPHNVLLMRPTDLGLTAVLIQVILWLYPIVIFIKNAKSVKRSEYYYIYLACGAIWVGIIFRSIFDTGGRLFGLIFLPVIFKMPKLIQDSAKMPIP